MCLFVGISPVFILPVTYTCLFCTILAVVFLPASYLFNKFSLANQKSRCYNEVKKKHFQSPFHFLISLFSWTPRDRLVNDPGALHLRRVAADNACTAWVVIATAHTRSVSIYCAISNFSICDESPLTMRTLAFSDSQRTPIHSETLCALKSTGLGDSKGERRVTRERDYPPLAGFFRIFLAGTRKIPAGGTAPKYY